MATRSSFIILPISPFAQLCVIDGEKLLFIVVANCIIADGIVFDTATNPIAKGDTNKLANNKSNPVCNK